ncbi:phosphatase PAP2 family protein [Sphingomonas alba]|uniref:Phosphatase PAP2 family protein n=1 Tax=Sphingomonas alba TaxID=2908208 RepID=A0ABT0RPJ2_9SPHN|nr:phosphatase PAP2 family protein [Sphingomonas alba]MCL6684579.1 phosphatase PAP2 family protein [Sphingomonas alba]
MLAILATRGVSGFRPSGYLGNLLLYVLTLGVMSVFVLGSLLFRHRPKSPIRFLWSQVASTSWMARIARGFPMLVVVAVLIPAFSAMKSSIPLFNTYSWDPVWIAADRAIHGTDAWRLLQPVAGFPIVTSLLSVAYHAWLFIVYAGSAYFCIFPRDRELRARYLISYFACWTIIGVAMAIMFASVGPCFLAPLTGDHHFDPLMSYLYSANQQYPVFVLPVQEQLLAWQQQNDHGLATGISAMPSMHVSMAMLFALSISKISRAAGAAAWLFVATIMIASVHLAYHYAVDGYVAILMTLAIWTVAKPLSRMVVNRPADTFQQAQAGLIGTAAT